ncbi:hypothetical protein [Streptomyces jeddahensis]|uniref:Uncharacterized protein n=1 Tax=Streptomyces jeddahensis TaxID=1716141 RepID=A0A177HFZ5_9ACTN|nr:hypothetical protein [Streptomyces jeddahensis]OAH09841.1 hypothetical protein STSP_68400 [Streptomyces jeddahensis]
MSVLARVALTAGVAAALAGGALTPAAAQVSSPKDAKHTYTCSNKGGGPNHTVNCFGLITVNNVLNNTTITVGDINVLTDNQLDEIEIALATASGNSVNQNAAIQLLKLEGTVLNTYLQNFDIVLNASKVNVCALSVCV